jgi:hypothetical protein
MACAMAAAPAGADVQRTDRWRELGGKFGVLRQLVNDQLDLVSGRGEDLANGTATYLLTYLLQSLTAARKEECLALHSAAAKSVDVRQKFRDQMLAPSVVGGYIESINAMVCDAHTTLDELCGEQAYLAELHALRDLISPPRSGPTADRRAGRSRRRPAGRSQADDGVRAENPAHGSDQQDCRLSCLTVMITGHVPAVRLSPDHADRYMTRPASLLVL